MALLTSGELDAHVDEVALLVRAMFPHEGFPEDPYRRSAKAIVDAAGEDARAVTQLRQGLAELAAADFADRDEAGRLDYLRGIAGTAFFEQVRAKVIVTLYDDPEVWSLLGYEGPCHEQGGYLERGFDDLDWLPAPRVEEAA